jgi:serine protease Do
MAKLGRATADKLAPGERDSAAAKDEGVLNGVTVGEITAELREQFHVPASVKGAIVTDVLPESPSAKQGLKEGDVIVQLGRKPVTNVEEAIKLSEELQGPKTLVVVWREGRTRYLVIDETPAAKK